MLEALNNILPQTQCGQCSFNGCRPYAEAIIEGEADINQCPPGGDLGIAKIAKLLGVQPKPLNTQFGEHKPKSVALIDEEVCIGCVKCIAACPVDAILGAAKFMHTVIVSECTGCELCIAPCPVDCITMQILDNPLSAPSNLHAKQRYKARQQRKEKEAFDKTERLRKQKERLASTQNQSSTT